MSVQHQEFQGRVARLKTKHAAYAQGYSTHVQSDGLIFMRPHKVRSRVSGKVFLLILAFFMVFKAFLMSVHGFDSYDERVAKLTTGNAVERVGALVMQSDPVSVWAAAQIGPILR